MILTFRYQSSCYSTIIVNQSSLAVQTPISTLQRLCMIGSCQWEQRASHFPQMFHRHQLAPALSRSTSLFLYHYLGPKSVLSLFDVWRGYVQLGRILPFL